jgi:hypothetical protein
MICAPISHHAPSAHACPRVVGVLAMHFHPIRVIIACLPPSLVVRLHPVGDCQTQAAELVGRHEGWVFCSLTANMTGWAGPPETDCPCVFSVASPRLVGKIHDYFILLKAQCKKRRKELRPGSIRRGHPRNDGSAESASADCSEVRIVALLCL